MWNVSDGLSRGEFRGSTGRVQSVAFSPDGAQLAVAAGDFSASIWNVATLSKRFDLQTMGHANYSAAYSSDGSVLAIGNGHGLVGLYHPKHGALDNVLAQHRTSIRTIAFSRSGRLLATGNSEGRVELWDVPNRSLRARLAGHRDRVWSVAFSPDARRLASASDDGTVRVWDITSEPAVKQTDYEHPLYSVDVSHDGTRVLTGTHNCDLITWDLATFSRQPNRITRGMMLRVSLDPQQRLLAAASDVGEVFVGESFSGPLSLFEPAKGRTVHGVALGKDARLFLSLAGGSIEVWDTQKKLLLDRREIGKSAGVPLAASADGRWVAMACLDLLVVYDMESLTPHYQQTTEVHYNSVAFSPDNRLLAVALIDGSIELLDARSGERLGVFLGHQLGAHALAFNADSRTLASTGRDNTLRLWHVATRQELFTLRRTEDSLITALAFSPDGRRLVATTGTRQGRGELMAWPASSDSR